MVLSIHGDSGEGAAAAYARASAVGDGDRVPASGSLAQHPTDGLESPAVAQDFETVELHGETDLTKLALAINFYIGRYSVGNVTAVVRLWVNRDVFVVPSRSQAGASNHGAAHVAQGHFAPHRGRASAAEGGDVGTEER